MLFSMNQSEASNSARTSDEVAFLRAVEMSDISTARRLLAGNPALNVDVIDALGRTALRLAVRNENRELVELLVEHCNSQNIQQAVLQAISEDHTSIAELILKHPCFLEICRKRQRLGDTDGFFKTEVESQFSTDMTPLNLAAQKNNYVIVQLLLQRGEVIPKPHKFSCSCVECRNRMKFDQLRMANFRLNAYRGLSSEAYISLSSEDPFLTGFQLAKELRKLSDHEKHFKKEYKDLANRISDYTVKLLDRVWTQQELNFVLNKKGPPHMEKYDNLARFKTALNNKEKKFVAHPSVQQHLMKIWHSDLNLETYGWHVRLPYLAGLAVLCPFITLAHFLKPQVKPLRKIARQPMVKFLGHIAYYLIFLLLLLISSTESVNRVSNKITLRTQYPHIATQYKAYWETRRSTLGPSAVPFGEDFPLRPHDPTVTEYLITIWVAGMLVQELDQIVQSGARAHFSDLFNVVDFLLLALYIGSFTLLYWVMHKSKLALAELDGKNTTMLLTDTKHTDLHLYWLNTDRMLWAQRDPSHMAEGLFAVANIFSFSRIINILPANEALGPMQISLGRMITDFMKFFVFTAIAVIAFIVSLRNLYWWYSDTDTREFVAQTEEDAATSFKDFISAFRTVFWWIYGRGAWEHALDVPTKYQENGAVTSEVGKILTALYHMTIIIVLVNLLIAMMARSFEKIVDDVDAEWKYARSVLFMETISEGTTLPVPFNLLLPVRALLLALRSSLARCARRSANKEVKDATPDLGQRPGRLGRLNADVRESVERQAGGRGNSQSDLATLTATTSDDQLSYRDIMQTIVQRYIFDIQREEEIIGDNVEEARLNLFHTKWDLLQLMEQRDSSLMDLSSCLNTVSTELSNLHPAPPPTRHPPDTDRVPDPDPAAPQLAGPDARRRQELPDLTRGLTRRNAATTTTTSSSNPSPPLSLSSSPTPTPTTTPTSTRRRLVRYNGVDCSSSLDMVQEEEEVEVQEEKEEGGGGQKGARGARGDEDRRLSESSKRTPSCSQSWSPMTTGPGWLLFALFSWGCVQDNLRFAELPFTW
ncbi:short transient receptor potential channel 7-like [Babylonia areolata]|uniref:short transient receptor potential channel 7-like n=1 Tax=Babylonia areolata TaxID=304850 RepID=UPI003FCF6F66